MAVVPLATASEICFASPPSPAFNTYTFAANKEDNTQVILQRVQEFNNTHIGN